MIIAVIIAIAICGIAFYFMEFHQAVYYTKIDNTRVEKISANDDMKYQYTLDCYNENDKVEVVYMQYNKDPERYGFKPRHYLLPIPATEIRQNPSMVQNEGW